MDAFFILDFFRLTYIGVSEDKFSKCTLPEEYWIEGDN
jgi:hypothetical protein